MPQRRRIAADAPDALDAGLRAASAVWGSA
jgi:hypothetical protein